MKKFFIILLSLCSVHIFSQTIVMNEVSNGPTGNMEYVEFIVVDTTVNYNCTGITNPPCIDIRGWIFDDNSGYHGPAGVASGCIRFSNNPFWSCIPVGTILLIYNELDPNSSLPAIDTLMSDGNCRIVVPVDKLNWFDRNATTPGALACSYPSTGWAASGTWSTTLMANTGDCARVVNTSGCEVFSVCWGTANTNTLVYFNGSAQDRVYFLNNSINNDASNQNNWTSGCADPIACGLNQQTPGAPNNTANANWINSMNNGCLPIQPLSVTSATTQGSCPCNASATVTPSGSLPPFTYTWSPNPGSGQGTAIAGGLCTGAYTCYVRSSTTKCTETVVLNVTNTNTLITTAITNGTYCSGSAIQLNTQAANSYTWLGPNGFTSTIQNPTISPASNNMSGTYSVFVTIGTCTANATTTLSVFPFSTVNIVSNSPICEGQNLILNGSNANGYTWLGPGSFTSSAQNNTISAANSSSSGTYTLTITDANTCTNVAVSNVTIHPLPSLSISVSNPCIGGTLNLGVFGGSTYNWFGPNSFTSSLQNPTITNVTSNYNGIYTVVATSSNNCVNSATTQVNLAASPVLTANGGSFCEGSNITLAAQGGNTFNWVGPNNFTSSIQNPTISPTSTLNAGTYTVIGSIGNCSSTATIDVFINPKPLVTISSNGPSICKDSVCYLNSNGGLNYSWSGPSAFTSTLQNPVIPNLSKVNEGIYILTVTGANSCINSASISINVNDCKCDPFIPEGFSPNGDGVHDQFKITCLEGRKTKIEIYNRWGNLVFIDDAYSNNWNGKSNSGINISGEDLPTGTYYYLIKFDDEEKTRTGFITLWR